MEVGVEVEQVEVGKKVVQVPTADYPLLNSI
jgi:hypothetical protein